MRNLLSLGFSATFLFLHLSASAKIDEKVREGFKTQFRAIIDNFKSGKITRDEAKKLQEQYLNAFKKMKDPNSAANTSVADQKDLLKNLKDKVNKYSTNSASDVVKDKSKRALQGNILGKATRIKKNSIMGNLTPAERKELQADLKAVKEMLKVALADGTISPEERALIREQAKKLGMEIKEKTSNDLKVASSTKKPISNNSNNTAVSTQRTSDNSVMGTIVTGYSTNSVSEGSR